MLSMIEIVRKVYSRLSKNGLISHHIVLASTPQRNTLENELGYMKDKT